MKIRFHVQHCNKTQRITMQTSPISGRCLIVSLVSNNSFIICYAYNETSCAWDIVWQRDLHNLDTVYFPDSGSQWISPEDF